MTTSASAIVERYLAEFIAGPDSKLKSVAIQYQALPVYSDMGGSLFITPALEILESDSENNSEPALETSAEWRLVAIVSAAEKFPDLRCLLPQRPADVPDCPQCAGRGRLFEPSIRCGECFGLGWQSLHSNNSLEGDAFKATRASS